MYLGIPIWYKFPTSMWNVQAIFFSFFYVVAYWRLLLCKLTIPVDVNDISFDSQHFKLFDFIICAVTYWFRVCTEKLLYFLANKFNTFIFSVLLKINCLVAISFHRFCPDRKWSAFRNNSLKCMQIFTFLLGSGAKIMHLFQVNLNNFGERSIMLISSQTKT